MLKKHAAIRNQGTYLYSIEGSIAWPLLSLLASACFWKGAAHAW